MNRFFFLCLFGLLLGSAWMKLGAESGQTLILSAAQSPKSLQSDYELTRSLVEQTQAQLGDFELLADEYETFQELEERLATDRENRELAQALVVCAKRLQEVLQRRHLREVFSSEFIKQVDFFANLHAKEGLAHE